MHTHRCMYVCLHIVYVFIYTCVHYIFTLCIYIYHIYTLYIYIYTHTARRCDLPVKFKRRLSNLLQHAQIPTQGQCFEIPQTTTLAAFGRQHRLGGLSGALCLTWFVFNHLTQNSFNPEICQPEIH